MGLYEERVLPHLIDRACGVRAFARYRNRVAAPLSGDVIEIGFGSGLNLPHLPEGVRALHAVEPSRVGRRLATERIDASRVPVTFVGLDGQSLDLESGRFDAALVTFSLCTIPDPGVALAEIRRVLRPGARLGFVEHGRSPDPSVARWQDRLNGIQRRLAGGCNLNRPIDRLIEEAGFGLERLDCSYAKGMPRPYSYLFEGVAVRAD